MRAIMVITVKALENAHACNSGVSVCRRLFGDSAKVTLANCQLAVKNDMDLTWAAENLFSAPARKAYEEAKAAARKAYKEAIAAAFYQASKLHNKGSKEPCE